MQKQMNQMGLKAKARKRHYHSYNGDIGKLALNVIERDFCTDKLNQKWAPNVTQVCINDRKLYLSPILEILKDHKHHSEFVAQGQLPGQYNDGKFLWSDEERTLVCQQV